MADKWKAPDIKELDENVAQRTVPDTASDVLFEIGVEELPAQDVDEALRQLHGIANSLFDDLRLTHGDVEVYATPRRLVLWAKQVAPMQTDLETVEKGPPSSRAFDADGKPTKAAEGFARGKGVDVGDLRVEEIDGGEYVVATVKNVGRPAVEVLAETLPEIIATIKFGKAMRWNDSGVAFSRPIRWIVALFGGAVIPFEYAGVNSGAVTRGLRPFGSQPHLVSDVNGYFDALKNQGIIVSLDERREAIVKQIKALADEVNGTIPDNSALLEEVTNLIEAPMALRGEFEAEYLALPRDVLVTVMRKHQRYFPLEDADGKLMPYFITVRNGDDKHLDKVAHGNEHVIRARFSDANFFYKEDIKKPLEGYLTRLGTLTFHEKLGSMLAKNQRVAGLVSGLGDLFGTGSTDVAIAERAAHIAKADLATNMVVEMTSLQGVMGREYALKSGFPEEVANTIFEHWLPRSAGDILPSSDAGALLALADRLDSLVGLFGAGLAPRSTADPYGLRRAALGLIEIMVARKIDADLMQAVNLAAAAQPLQVSDQAKEQVLDFIAGRLRVWMSDKGFSADVVNAVLAEQSANPYRAVQGAEQLAAWVARDDWAAILDSFARCVRITRNEPTQFDVDPALFQQSEENALYDAYQSASANLDEHGNVDAFLTAFVPLVPAVTAYFGTGKGDGVLVNADDPAIRKNRLGLLQAISSMQTGRADLSEMAGF
ncbi:MAG: glycine--tRNA ligase subunit beta [Aggregatilineales bacterium]